MLITPFIINQIYYLILAKKPEKNLKMTKCVSSNFMKYKVPAFAYSPRAHAQVPSALAGLTSEFGMGSGVTLPLKIPRLYIPYFN